MFMEPCLLLLVFIPGLVVLQQARSERLEGRTGYVLTLKPSTRAGSAFATIFSGRRSRAQKKKKKRIWSKNARCSAPGSPPLFARLALVRCFLSKREEVFSAEKGADRRLPLLAQPTSWESVGPLVVLCASSLTSEKKGNCKHIALQCPTGHPDLHWGEADGLDGLGKGGKGPAQPSKWR